MKLIEKIHTIVYNKKINNRWHMNMHSYTIHIHTLNNQKYNMELLDYILNYIKNYYIIKHPENINHKILHLIKHKNTVYAIKLIQ
jgi:hypothetical protein